MGAKFDRNCRARARACELSPRDFRMTQPTHDRKRARGVLVKSLASRESARSFVTLEALKIEVSAKHPRHFHLHP